MCERAAERGGGVWNALWSFWIHQRSNELFQSHVGVGHTAQGRGWRAWLVLSNSYFHSNLVYERWNSFKILIFQWEKKGWVVAAQGGHPSVELYSSPSWQAHHLDPPTCSSMFSKTQGSQLSKSNQDFAFNRQCPSVKMTRRLSWL